MVLHRYSSFFFLFLVFPSFIWSVALSLGPGHWCHWSFRGKSLFKDAGNSSSKSKYSMHFSTMLAPWRGLHTSGGWDPSLCKMCVNFLDPALVVPCDGTGWPDFWVWSWWWLGRCWKFNFKVLLFQGFLCNVGSMVRTYSLWRLGPILVQNVCQLSWPCPCGSLWWYQLTRILGLILLMTLEKKWTMKMRAIKPSNFSH